MRTYQVDNLMDVDSCLHPYNTMVTHYHEKQKSRTCALAQKVPLRPFPVSLPSPDI